MVFGTFDRHNGNCTDNALHTDIDLIYVDLKSHHIVEVEFKGNVLDIEMYYRVSQAHTIKGIQC